MPDFVLSFGLNINVRMVFLRLLDRLPDPSLRFEMVFFLQKKPTSDYYRHAYEFQGSGNSFE